MLLKRIRLGLIHVAVAMTLVPINSTLNRVMIKELGLSAALVALLASLPYLFAPLQMLIGSFSDRHPVFRLRRSPYILAGLVLCVLGVSLAPLAAFWMAGNFWPGLLALLLAFGAWGMGYNLASVSYLSLASELSGEAGRGKTIATMWFMMIVAIILTAIGLGRMVDPYTPAALVRAFWLIGGAALLLGLLGLIGLEKQARGEAEPAADVHSIRAMAGAVFSNRTARTFFLYLLLLLAAILGQDVLLEPFAAQAFGLTVRETTRITSLWGTFVLVAILVAGALEGRAPKRLVAQIGNLGALAGFLGILAGGLLADQRVFYAGVTLLGLGTGLSTVANLALMFDLTVPGSVGLFIGAWGFSNALSRLLGSLLGGVLRDVVTGISGDALAGYLVVFGVEAAMLFAAIFLLGRIDVKAFRQAAEEPSFVEKVALAGE
jgi:BCD family chlorophyll transporter-like MFS transporter